MKAADIKPDFAYPATESKTAESDLQKAVKSHDAHAAFNALVRYWIAQSKIDPGYGPATIKKAEDVAGKFSDDKLHGLFLSLIAQMYYEEYSRESWNYDDRELPLTPLPENITEWSGKQYKAKISSLLLESVSGKNAEGLASLAIRLYPDIIKANREAMVYFPTLLDFAFLRAYQLSDQCDNDEDKALILKRALDNSPAGSAPYVYWITVQEKTPRYSSDRLINLIRRMSDNEYAGYIFTELNGRGNYSESPVEEELPDGSGTATPVADPEMRYNLSVYNLAVDYLKKFPHTMFVTEIKDIIGKITQHSVTVSTSSLCAPGTPFEVKIVNKNAPTFTLNIYKLKDSETEGGVLTETLISTRKPVESRTFTSDKKAPFKTDSVLSLVLAEPGQYAIVAIIPGGKKERNLYSSIRCVPVFPVAVSNARNPRVAVVNPVTGAPMQGVTVKTETRKNQLTTTKVTDSKGLAELGLTNGGNVWLTYNGQKYDFSEINISGVYNYVDTAAIYHASVVTDRGIYHPGEKLHVLAVVSKSHSKLAKPAGHRACDNQRITIMLVDANYSLVDTIVGFTDEYGRVKAEFDLPADRLTGEYQIRVSLDDTTPVQSGRRNHGVIGSQSFMVSDFKLPDFEVTDAVATNDTPAKGDVSVTAKAVTYSGVPVTDAKVEVFISGKTWLWWRANAYKLFAVSAKTDDEGKLSVVIPDSVFAANKDYSFFEARIEVESATGAKSSTSTIFSIGKKYLIDVKCDNVIDGNTPFAPQVEVNASDGSKVTVPLTWSLAAKDGGQVAGGEYTGRIDLSAVTPGNYSFIVAAADTTLAAPSKTSVTIYNTRSDVVPGESRLWILQEDCVTDNGKYDILYGTPYDDTWVYCAISDGTGEISDMSLVCRKKGYHHIPVKLPDGQQRIYVDLFTVNGFKVSKERITVERRKPDTSLKIVGETFRDKLIPGSEETWKIRITGADGHPQQSALALDMYNSALDALWDHDPYVSVYGSTIYSTLRLNYPYLGSWSYWTSVPFKEKGHDLALPRLNFYGQKYDFMDYQDVVVMGYGTMRKSSNAALYRSAAPAAAEFATADEAIEEAEDADAGATDGMETPTGEGDSKETADNDFDYRADYVPLAVWAPMLTTDAEGNITYTFSVPNANTTWRLLALAWTKDFRLGRMVREFVAAKPLMVTPNLPRFLRNGDHAAVRASVMNNSDKAVTAVTVVELFNPVTGKILDSKEFRNEIAPGMTETVTSDITADYNLDAIGYRVRTSNGEFSDGEQSVVRVLPADASLIETRPFYLNPGETEYTTELPKDKGARISLTFMENPSWAILTALPGLRTQIDEYANSAAAALYSAGIARGLIKDNPNLAKALRTWSENPGDSTLVSMLEKNEDLKIALLNATPWVQAAQSDTERMANLALLLDDSQVSASINKAFGILKDLQQSDGGWKWAKWCDESSVFVTSNVLGMMADLKTLGWMPQIDGIDSMLKKALKFYDSKVDDTDLVYTILRPQFADVPVSNNGKTVIDRTIREISTDWKKYDDVAYKAMAAEALYRNREQMFAAELMRSISEFGVMTKDQGLKFPSVNALYNYAILLEAYNLIKPGSPEAEGLRQQLIIRKQGSDWGSAVVTTQVVQSLLASSGKWLVDARGAEVSVGSHTIQPTSEIEKLTGWLRTDLSEYAGKKLKIETTGTGPAYGAVYAQFSRNMADVKASGCDDLDIEKTTFVRRGLDWEEARDLKVGDRVKVQLTIHCKRNLNYVSIVDERPACYQPADQIPGWLWSEGAAFYRENRDSSTQLHIVYLRPGTYLLTYEMDVNNAGDFSSGVATIQSQYAPEISAHSSGHRISVTE